MGTMELLRWCSNLSRGTGYHHVKNVAGERLLNGVWKLLDVLRLCPAPDMFRGVWGNVPFLVATCTFSACR